MIEHNEPMIFEQRGTVGILTLNRPDRMNAMNGPLVRGLRTHFETLADDDSIRSVILTAAGEKAFCVGADLKERQTMSEDEVTQRLKDYRTSFDAITRIPKPVICAINGYAFGGGLELALACDFRIAASTAKMGLTETHLGIIPGAGGTQRLSRLVGPTRAKDLVFSARRMSANEALEERIICRVTDPETLLGDAIAWAETFDRAAPIAIAQAKRAIDLGVEMSLDDGLQFETTCYNVTLESEDRLEGLAAFKAKRDPEWSNR